MATENARALQAFDHGVRNCGYRIDDYADGQQNAEEALRGFEAATQLNPDMCDAWLGQIYASRLIDAGSLASSEVVWKAYQCRSRVFDEQTRVGLPVPTLYGNFRIDSMVNFVMYDADTIAVAQAAEYTRAGEYAEAERVLAELHPQEPPTQVVVKYARAANFFAAQLWPDVMDVLKDFRGWQMPDAYQTWTVRCPAASLMGQACARLGMFHQAISCFDLSEEPAPGHEGMFHATAMQPGQLMRALVRRAEGNEDEAKRILEQLVAQAPADLAAEAKRYLANPSERLQVVSEEQVRSRSDRWNPDTAADADELNADRNQVLLDEATAELDSMIGLEPVKSTLRKLQISMQVARTRKALNLSSANKQRHYAFVGPAGVGKTRTARIFAQQLAGLSIVKRPDVIETHGNDLTSGWKRQSAGVVNEFVDKALDAVGFIDEAYALAPETSHGNVDEGGQEAIDSLIKRMYDDKDRLTLIFAGYEDDTMRLLEANQGLVSRIGKIIRFPSYTPEELVRIAEVMAGPRDALLDDSAKYELLAECERMARDTRARRRRNEFDNRPPVSESLIDYYGNARFIENVLISAEEAREERLVDTGVIDVSSAASPDPTDQRMMEQLMTLVKDDIRYGLDEALRAGTES